MTSQSPIIYLYKITFEEVPYYYYGVHKEKYFNEEYWGSPITHKWCWEFYTPKKQILEIFNCDDEGWLKAQEIEKQLIKPVINTDKWCLNKNCGGIISLDILKENGKKVSKKYSRLNGIKNGKKAKELGIGIHGRTKEQMTADGKKGGLITGKECYELGKGIFERTKKQISEDGRKGGEKLKELGIGIHGRTKEQMTADGKKGGKIVAEMHKKNRTALFGRTTDKHSSDSKKGGQKSKELGIGIHGRTKEQMTADGKKAIKNTNSQKWMCLETGYITNSGALSHYQKARGIDTSKRVRVS